jgi:flagellar biosynthesis/type III secretory pathway protein FliH
MRNLHWGRWTALALAVALSAGCTAAVGAQGRWGGGWGPPPGHGRYVDVAYARGFDDGYARGRTDGRNRARFDVRGQRLYRQADAGYHRRYGSRNDYKQLYRRGFSAGYEEGYREMARGRRGRW